MRYRQVKLIAGVERLNEWLKDNAYLYIVDIQYSATDGSDLFVVVWEVAE